MKIEILVSIQRLLKILYKVCQSPKSCTWEDLAFNEDHDLLQTRRCKGGARGACSHLSKVWPACPAERVASHDLPCHERREGKAITHSPVRWPRPEDLTRRFAQVELSAMLNAQRLDQGSLHTILEFEEPRLSLITLALKFVFSRFRHLSV